MLTQLQQQTAQSLSRMRPAGDPKILFNQIDWAVWSSCLRAMREGSGVQTPDFEEFRRLAYGGIVNKARTIQNENG
jgi:hypothetical protein